MKQIFLWFLFSNFIVKWGNCMWKNSSVREIVIAGLFIAMGLVLPMVFHSFDLGSSFLPMHIPVLISGFVLSAPFATIVGALTPFLSAIITGMPPLYPVMPYMVFELAAYAAVVSVISRKLKWIVYLTLVLSMAVGRIVAGAAVWLMVAVFGAKLPNPFVFISTAVVTGIPGIIIQLIAIPPLVMLLKKTNVIRNEACKIG